MFPRSLAFLFELVIVVAWVGLLVHSRLRMKDTGAPETESLALLETVTEGPGTEWMSVYLNGKKIGCGFSDRIKQRGGWRLQERMYLRLRAFEQNREIVTALVAHTDAAHRLRRFDFMLSASPSHLHVSGVVRGKILDLQIETGGETRSQQLRLDAIPELSVTFKERFLAQAPQVGDVLAFPYFDPTTLSQQTLHLEVVGEGVAKVDGKPVRTFEIHSSYHGLESTAVVTEDGLTLEETNPLGMKMRRETRDQAINGGWGDGEFPVDIVALSAVPVEHPIENARSIQYFHARLTGGGVEVLLGKPTEGMRPGEVEVRVPPRSTWRSYHIPLVDPRFSRALADTPLVQTSDPRIARAAQSIIGDVTDAVEAAALLNRWVHDTLKKEPVMGVPSALEVLAEQRGDCNEHTTLFTALARSIGIPTRMAAGLVYSGSTGTVPGFYYHAWPEVYLGVWVPLDPTFGQFPADATHIELVEGDLEDQLSLIRVVGNVQVDVIDYY